LLALGLLGWGLAAPPASSQNVAQVYMITPEQGAESGLEAAMRQHATWREEHGDPWGWNVYEVVQGKHPGTYIVRSPGHAWADFDEYTQGFGPKAGQHYNATVAPMAASTSSSIVELDTSLTHLPDDMSEYHLIEVTSYRLKPGHGQDFVEALEKAFQAVTQETEERYLGTAHVVNGAEADHVRLVVPHTSWADFKAPDRTVEDILVEVYGEDETEQLFEQFGNAYSSSYNMVVRYRPELSVEAQQ
jgi:hypothetical protein